MVSVRLVHVYILYRLTHPRVVNNNLFLWDYVGSDTLWNLCPMDDHALYPCKEIPRVDWHQNMVLNGDTHTWYTFHPQALQLPTKYKHALMGIMGGY